MNSIEFCVDFFMPSLRSVQWVCKTAFVFFYSFMSSIFVFLIYYF
jgi:hypothetical protein